jgi:hypothetical protein
VALEVLPDKVSGNDFETRGQAADVSGGNYGTKDPAAVPAFAAVDFTGDITIVPAHNGVDLLGLETGVFEPSPTALNHGAIPTRLVFDSLYACFELHRKVS